MLRDGWPRRRAPARLAGMAISRDIEPLPHDDARIREALADAHLPSLLPALAQLTGDLSLLRDDLFPESVVLTDPQGGL